MVKQMYGKRIGHGAIHEAGHAVVAKKQGKLRVTKVHYTGPEGFCSWENVKTQEARYALLCAHLAGIAAEEMFAPGEWTRFECQNDLDMIEYLLSLFDDPDFAESHKRKATEEVDRILRENKRQVLAIASALMETDDIAGDDLEKLFV